MSRSYQANSNREQASDTKRRGWLVAGSHEGAQSIEEHRWEQRDRNVDSRRKRSRKG